MVAGIDFEIAPSRRQSVARASSAFGYFGSKARLSREILKYLPPHHCWVELFCGSAAVTMAKRPSNIEIINDLDGDIVNVFRQLREHPDQLVRLIALTPYAKSEYEDASMKDAGGDDLERARRFLVRAMMSVNGVLGRSRGGFSFSNSYSRSGREARVNRWLNYPDRLEAVAERVRCIRIENRDAVTLLQEFSNRPATLVYIDPPYLVKRKSGYVFDVDSDDFHERLLRQAVVSKCMILVSGYDSEMYNRLLSSANGWSRMSFEAFTKATSGNELGRNEVLWMNTLAAKALERNRVPIRLSKKEALEQKVNPTRGAIRRYSHRYRIR